MPRGRTCSICAVPATVKAVDAALATGSSVAEVVRLYADTLGFGESAAYRHARHSHEVGIPLSLPLPEGESLGDSIRVLVAVQQSQLAALARADAKGDDKLAASAADRLRAVSHELLDAGGADAHELANDNASMRAFIQSLTKAARRHPYLIRDLASAYREVDDHGNADELEALAAHAIEHTKNNV